MSGFLERRRVRLARERDHHLQHQALLVAKDARDAQHRSNRIQTAALVVALIGLVVGGVTLYVTTRINEGVEDIQSLTPQEIVDRLHVGMRFEELTALFEERPAADAADEYLQESMGTAARRVVFVPSGKHMVVVALLDGRSEAWLFSVTALDGLNGGLRFPPSSTGAYALADLNGHATSPFETGSSVLGDLLPDSERRGCLDASIGYMGDTSGYMAIGCDGYGFTNYEANVVGVNILGKGEGNGLEIALSQPNETLNFDRLPDGAGGIVFNTFAWMQVNPSIGGPADGGDQFRQFVERYELGPGRYENLGIRQ